jgi:hypothetical protein
VLTASCAGVSPRARSITDPRAGPESPGPPVVARPPSGVIIAAAALDSLHAAIGPHVIRVTCAQGIFELPEAVLDSSGVWSRAARVYAVPRTALVETPDAPRPVRPPRPIPWESIERIEVGRSQWREYAAFGGYVGLLVSVVATPLTYYIFYVVDSATGRGSLAMVPLIGIAGGTAIGAAAGAPLKKWRVVYGRQ